jgi:hypothetical protein
MSTGRISWQRVTTPWSVWTEQLAGGVWRRSGTGGRWLDRLQLRWNELAMRPESRVKAPLPLDHDSLRPENRARK